MKNQKKLGAFLLVTTSIATGLFTGASAQEDDYEFSEIVVTAQGREESIQDVSIAIDATPGMELQDRVIVDVENFALQSPSLTISESPFQRSVAIRGVGSTGGNIGYEQSAPFFVDGVFAGRAQQFLTPFFDLDRVEIIKGPQAIFFGKNATAGAVSVNSARPTDSFYASVNAGYEVENEGYLAEGVISGPISDTVRGRFAVRSARRGDYLFDTSLGEEVGGANDFAARLGLEWDANDILSFYLKAEYADREADRRIQTVCANPEFTELTVSTRGFPATTIECIEDNRLSSGSDVPPFDETLPPGTDFQDNDATNVVLKSDLILGEHIVEFTTAYSAYDASNIDGLDRSSAGVATSNIVEDFEQYSQEIRVLSPTAGMFEYVVGFQFLDQNHVVDQTIAQLEPAALAGPAGVVFIDPAGDLIQVEQDTVSYSLFGQLTWNFMPTARIKAGFRYSNEDKDYESLVTRTNDLDVIGSLTVDNPPTGTEITDQNQLFLDRSEEAFDPSVTLEWLPLDDTMIYATYARGTKAGGFEFLPRGAVSINVDPAGLEYDEEEAINYELGVKSTLAGGRVRFNASAFYTELKDLQTQVLNISDVSFITLNIPESHSTGLEIDTSAFVTNSISVGGSMTWLAEARVDEAPASQPDYEDNRLPFAPELAGTMYADAEWPVGPDYMLNARIQGNYTGEVEFEVTNIEADRADSFFTLDARLGLDLGNGLEVYVNGRNLLDNDDIRLHSASTLLGLVPGPNAGNPRGVVLAEGRTIHLMARKEF